MPNINSNSVHGAIDLTEENDQCLERGQTVQTAKRFNRQKGIATIDLLLFFAFVMLFIVGILQFVPELRFGMSLQQAQSQVSEIQRATERWKGVRSNYTGLTMSVLCTTNRLNDSICGSGGTGADANPWGGDYVLTVTGGNPGEYSLDITNIDNDRVTEVADTFAPISRDRCSSSTGCASSVISSQTVKITF